MERNPQTGKSLMSTKRLLLFGLIATGVLIGASHMPAHGVKKAVAQSELFSLLSLSHMVWRQACDKNA